MYEHPAVDPTLVLFFSDGGVYRNKAIEQELRAAVEEPIFWQFVGLGRSNYGVLERFDTLPGRRVDNVGFFAVDDISGVPDPELYDRLLSQFPAWMTAARGSASSDGAHQDRTSGAGAGEGEGVGSGKGPAPYWRRPSFPSPRCRPAGCHSGWCSGPRSPGW